MPHLRPYRTEDLGALYRIALATGDAGRDAAPLHDDPSLIGAIYAAPYGVLNPDLVLVAEDAEGVAGYVVGALDTEAWQRQLERDWWPDLRRRLARPDPALSATWTADEKRQHLIHNPERVPDAVTAAFPGHMHMNLLPRLQGRGLGRRLFEAWLAAARDRGAGALHVGANAANAGAIAFWTRMGFQRIDGIDSRSVWLGRP